MIDEMNMEIKKHNNPNRGFEELVERIFMSNGYETERESYNSVAKLSEKGDYKYRYDVIARKNNVELLIEVKYYRQKEVPFQMIEQAIGKMNRIDTYGNRLLVVSSIIPDKKRFNSKGIIIIDLADLLSFVCNSYNLFIILLSYLDFSVSDIKFKSKNFDSFISRGIRKIKKNPIKCNIEETRQESDRGKLLRKSIKEWRGEGFKYYTEYENLCIDILQYLFSDALGIWEKQKNSNDNLYRFDLICSVKDGNKDEFWKFILDFFKSKYVVFEFKNYTDQITQREVYTTEKYLYLKAFRSVGFIISNNGCSENAIISAKGILRENGKLLICLANEDLEKMLLDKINGGSGSELLSNRLDKMLIELEK